VAFEPGGEVYAEGIAEVGAAGDHALDPDADHSRPQQTAHVFDFRELGHAGMGAVAPGW
jgi:hypothetical protein